MKLFASLWTGVFLIAACMVIIYDHKKRVQKERIARIAKALQDVMDSIITLGKVSSYAGAVIRDFNQLLIKENKNPLEYIIEGKNIIKINHLNKGEYDYRKND